MIDKQKKIEKNKNDWKVVQSSKITVIQIWNCFQLANSSHSWNGQWKKKKQMKTESQMNLSLSFPQSIHHHYAEVSSEANWKRIKKTTLKFSKPYWARNGEKKRRQPKIKGNSFEAHSPSLVATTKRTPFPMYCEVYARETNSKCERRDFSPTLPLGVVSPCVCACMCLSMPCGCVCEFALRLAIFQCWNAWYVSTLSSDDSIYATLFVRFVCFIKQGSRKSYISFGLCVLVEQLK